MSAIPPDNKKQTLTKARKRGFLRSLTPFDGTNQTKLFNEIDDIMKELVRAVDELQSLQVASRTVDSTGRPVNNARCEVFDGQFIRLTQTAAAPMLVKVEHGLDRVPQGAFQLLTNTVGVTRCFIQGDKALGISPADENRLTFQLNGALSDEYMFIVF